MTAAEGHRHTVHLEQLGLMDAAAAVMGSQQVIW